jgi:hypothetical protein
MTIDEFLAKWENCPGHERSNYAAFLSDFATVLELPTPGPGKTQALGDYQFDGPVAGGSEGGNTGFVDLYKRGAFILEAKQSKVCEMPSLPIDAPAAPEQGKRYDELMRRAFRQARRYAVNLPSDHPWPPFIIISDVGRSFELYFDYAGNGRDYRFFPDRHTYRIPIASLRDPEVQQRFRTIWTNARSLDPTLVTVDVTRTVARRLADVSKHLDDGLALEAKRENWTVLERETAREGAALFIMRLLFCMFAEDIGLLPKERFTNFLKSCAVENEDRSQLMNRERLERGLQDLWAKMDSADPAARWTFALDDSVRYFNGGLFESRRVFPLFRNDLDALIEAAGHRWQNVEPAIFGTFLEQALGDQRSRLGAHYTPRPYVERIVEATILDVLRPEWEAVESALEGLAPNERLIRLRAFHDRIAQVTVLDPACGTGNFLYVAMDALLGLEAKVLQAIEDNGGVTKSRIGPGQFQGLELNTSAAKVTELVLWIGWLRRGLTDHPDDIPEPILGQRACINFGKPGPYDAVLKQDETGQPDLSNPAPPQWPEAEFIVGNPPFIGKGSEMRKELGNDYVEALWKANPSVPKSADFVMQWWDRAARILTSPGTKLRRFGFVTTNKVKQKFNRRVLSEYIEPKAKNGEEVKPISIVMAVPDHPWYKKPRPDGPRVKRKKGNKDSAPAAIRIAMTVAEAGVHAGRLATVTSESGLDTETPILTFSEVVGRINIDLTVGTDATSAKPLLANSSISTNGMLLAGRGFVLTQADATHLLRKDGQQASQVIRPYLGGSELVQNDKHRFVIDLFDYSEREVRTKFPKTYQHLLEKVKPVRDNNNRESYKQNWWIFAEPRRDTRLAFSDLRRYIGTTETTKHRIFSFVEGGVVPDHMIVAIAADDAFHLGVLSSRIHLLWTYANAGLLGVAKFEQGHRYTKSQIFETFPFPRATDAQRSIIRDLGEELDATRRIALVDTPRLTLTELYNLRAQILSGDQLSFDIEERAASARVRIIDRLHEQIDSAVSEAYDWPTNLAPTEIVAQLVALNAERKVEEDSGTIRWLRPDYQERRFAKNEE